MLFSRKIGGSKLRWWLEEVHDLKKLEGAAKLADGAAREVDKLK